MAERRFKIGDEVYIRGVVSMLDAAGVGTVTIEIHASGQRRITLRDDANSLELASKGPQGGGLSR